MTFSVTIGSYMLANWVELNIVSCKHVFGPDTPILISDDISDESESIKLVAEEYGCGYTCSDRRRYHFAGDLQSTINSLVWARSQECDIAVKVSQRMILASIDIPAIVERAMENPDIKLALPGRPDPRHICGSKGFSHYPFLTDVIFMRTNAIEPEFLKERYESRWKGSNERMACFVEALFADLIGGDWKNNTASIPELTGHKLGEAKRFHRRYMSTSAEFRRWGQSIGLDGYYQTGEWKQLDGQYNPRPRA